MTQPASVGTFSKCAISQTSTFGAGSALEFMGVFGLKMHQEIVGTDGARGTHAHPAERTRPGRRTCSGPISFQPGKADLDLLLPFITGSTKNGSNQFIGTGGSGTLLAESLIPFLVVVDRIAKVHTYAGATSTTAGCWVASAVFHVAEGEPLSLTINVEAIDEYSGNSGTFPAGATFNYQQPYMWSDSTGAFSVGGSVTQFKECTITWTNRLKTDRFMNSAIRTDIPFIDRIITADVVVPSTSDQAALLAYPGVTAEAFSLTLTQGSDSISFASSAWEIEPESPDTPAREEETLHLHGRFYQASAGTVPELTITNVSA